MSRTRFEKQFQEELNRREITPSGDSWKKLSMELDKRKKRSWPFFALGIAASLAGAIFILNFFFQESSVNENPVIVNQPNVEVRDHAENEIISQEQMTSIIVENAAKEKLQVEKVLKPQKVQREMISGIGKEEETLTEPEFSDPEILTPQLTVNVLAEAKVPQLQHSVTDAEIDALLSKALEDIEYQGEAPVAQAFSSEELLWEVERELEKSFRRQIFEAVLQGFEQARTAIANRNF